MRWKVEEEVVSNASLISSSLELGLLLPIIMYVRVTTVIHYIIITSLLPHYTRTRTRRKARAYGYHWPIPMNWNSALN